MCELMMVRSRHCFHCNNISIDPKISLRRCDWVGTAREYRDMLWFSTVTRTSFVSLVTKNTCRFQKSSKFRYYMYLL